MAVKPLLRVRAPAKINLSLRVLGAAPGGYHELRTVLQTVDLHDTLTFEPRSGPFGITCDDPACPTDETNLAWRAAEALARAAGGVGPPRDIVVRIAKKIPMQAGLGGGSSDAAAVLRGFASLWRVHIPREKMRAIAASLGSDVPFFLEGGTMLGLARGDHLFPLVDHPPAWVTLMIPRFGVSTMDAYAWHDQRASSVVSARSPANAEGTRSAFMPYETGNDLQAAVVERHPEIGILVGSLLKAGANYAAMSGSGSAVFGLFQTRAAAIRAAAGAAARGGRGLVTRFVNRMKYQTLAGI